MDKGALLLPLLCVVLCPRGRSWDVAGPVPNHGRQRPLMTHIHSGDNRRHDSMVGKQRVSTTPEHSDRSFSGQTNKQLFLLLF